MFRLIRTIGKKWVCERNDDEIRFIEIIYHEPQ